MSFYSSMPTSFASKVLPRFEVRFPGIKVEHTRAPSDKLVQRITTERQAGQSLFDVVESSKHVKSVIQRFSQPYRVAAWDDFPAGAKDASDRWLSTRLNSVFPAFNTTKVKPGDIQTWKDLCNKRYEGRVAFEISDVDIYTGLKEIFGEAEAQAIVRCVAANRAVGRSGHSEMANLLAAGEFWATFSSLGPRLAELKFEQRAPVDWVRTDPIIVVPVVMALSDNPPHPNAARLFMEWLASPEGQQALAETGQLPASSKVQPRYPDLLHPGRLLFVGVDHWLNQADEEFWRATFKLQ